MMVGSAGYVTPMTSTPDPPEVDAPIEREDVPHEEDITAADADDRADDDPGEQNKRREAQA
jgi:hypothetical protein